MPDSDDPARRLRRRWRRIQELPCLRDRKQSNSLDLRLSDSNSSPSSVFKAAIIRIDSLGVDALAFDLVWREIKLLTETKPVIASMSDVGASEAYYMAMAANTIVAENLTLTGSIVVVTARFTLAKLYEKIGFNKETISRGKYADLPLQKFDFISFYEEMLLFGQTLPLIILQKELIFSKLVSDYK